MPLFPVLTMLTFPQRLTKLTSRIPGYIYLWLAIPIFGSSSALTRKITEIGAEHFVGGHNPISYCNVLLAAYLILGEVPTHAQYIGGVVILVGLFLGQLGIKARTNSRSVSAKRRRCQRVREAFASAKASRSEKRLRQRLKSIGISSMETEQEIEEKMGFKGI